MSNDNILDPNDLHAIPRVNFAPSSPVAEGEDWIEAADKEIKQHVIEWFGEEDPAAIIRKYASRDSTPPEDAETEAEEIHEIWSDGVAKLCERIGVDPKSFDWSPGETAEETIGNILGKINDRLDRRTREETTPPAPAFVGMEPGFDECYKCHAEACRLQHGLENCSVCGRRFCTECINDHTHEAPSSPVAAMTREEREEIMLIRNAVPFIDAPVGVTETQSAFDKLLSHIAALQAEADRLKTRLGEAEKVMRELTRAWDERQLPVSERMESALKDADNFLAAAKSGQEEKK